MKKKQILTVYPFIILGMCLILLGGCTKENDDNNDDELSGTPVMVSGTVDASAEQATKVLAISPDNKFKQAVITNSKFSIELDNSEPWGLIFLNGADQPLGLLSLGNGIESLPLHYIKSTLTAIELDTISQTGFIFTTSNNPIGNTIPLTGEQIEVVASMDDYLAAMLKNPDVDGNGKIDVLEGKSFRLSPIYFIKPGNFHVPDLTPTLNPQTLIEGYRLFLTVEDASYPETIYFTGPTGSPLLNTASESYLSFDDSRVYNTPYLFDLSGSGSYIPPGGIYKIKYGSSTLTFDLSDQSYVTSNIVYLWPTITLNTDGTLNKVDWVSKLPAGTTNFDLSALISNIMVQLGGTGPACTAIPNQSGLYGSDRLPANTTTHTFACQNMVWGSVAPYPGAEYVERLMLTYEDHYGASYVVMYEKEY